jgi:hypothetical protein
MTGSEFDDDATLARLRATGDHIAEALAPFGPSLQMAGWLHDILEDTRWTADELREAGVPGLALTTASGDVGSGRGPRVAGRQPAVAVAPHHPAGVVRAGAVVPRLGA